MTEQCVTMQVAYVCTGLLYIICVCLCVCVCVCVCVFISVTVYLHSRRGVLLKDYHRGGRLSGAQKIGLFSLTGCQSASLFFPPLCSTSLHLSLSLSLFSPCISSQWNEKGWALVSMSNGGVIVSVSCLSLQCVGPDPSCRAVTAVQWWDAKNFVGFVEGEIKHGTRLIWHPYLHGIGPLKHRQVSQPD